MYLEEKWYKLKDGRMACLRSPREEDIQGTLDYLRKSAEETVFLLRYPEECDKYTYEKEKELFEKVVESPDDFFIVCTVDGKVAGNCHIMFNNRIKTKHRGEIGIAILKDYWGQRIGTYMFEEMIAAAKRHGDILQIELDFIEGNERALHLYEKMGFKITGEIPNAIRLKDGTLLKEYHMVKNL